MTMVTVTASYKDTSEAKQALSHLFAPDGCGHSGGSPADDDDVGLVGVPLHLHALPSLVV